MTFTLGTSAGAGTITVAQGSAVVTGVGTSFAATDIGRIIVVGSQWGIIGTFVSTTVVGFTTPFATAVTASAYQISATIPVITQTGTDTSLAGLTGVPGVTTNPAASSTIWTITSASLVINGSLTINRLTNRLRFLNSAAIVNGSTTAVVMTVGATGTFNNSTSQTSGGYSYHTSSYSILFETLPTAATTTASFFTALSGSTTVLEGNIEFSSTNVAVVLLFNFSGTATLQYGGFVNSSSGVGANMLFVVPTTTSILTLNNWTTYGCSLRVADNTTNISNYAAIAGVNAININTVNPISNAQYVGLQDLGNTTAIRYAGASLKYAQFINFSSTTQLPGFSAGGNAGSQWLLVNQLALSASGASGAIQDVKFWAQDSNNGSRYSANYGAGTGYEIATTGNLTYTTTTASTGIAPTLNIISVVYYQPTGSTFTRDFRGNLSSTSFELNIYQCAYNYVLSNAATSMWVLNNGIYGSPNVKNQGFVLLTDTSITQTTMATVAAYTTLDTAQQFYDYAKYYLYTNFAGQTATYVTRASNTINAGSYNVTVDATASTPFVFAGSTITAKSSTFTGSITTSGLVTLANGAVFSNNTITANVAQATPTDLTGVAITGNLTFNTNSPITITLTNCSINGTVSNSGTGLVTINLTNSTIGTVGSNIASRITTSLNINGLTAGSQIYIADGTGTQVDYVASSSTSYTRNTTGGVGTWTYKVARYGYTAQTGTHSPAVASTTATVTLIADAFITQPTVATVAAYTVLNNLDKLYDYSAYYETTNAGINYARTVTKAGTAASIGSYNATLNSTGSVWAFDGSRITMNAASTLASGSTITGGLFTSGTVTLTTAMSNTTITGNVLQTTPTDLTSVTITGNLTFNTNSPVTVTFTGCTITGTASNSGSGAVVIRTSNTTIGTAGTNVTQVLVTSLTLNGLTAGSQIYIANGAGAQVDYVASSGTSYGINTTGSTGTWTYKVAQYGFITSTGTFTPATASFTFIITLLPDANVVDTLANVSAYTQLTTAQQIYDYISYYNTTNTGIANPAAAVKSFGAIDFLASNVILDPSAAAVIAGTTTLTIKTTGLVGDDTYYSAGNFTLGLATLSSEVKIRMANLNSELEFVGISNIDLYSTEIDRNNRDNLRMSITTSPYRFLYGSTVNSVLFASTLYTETTASVQYEYDIPIASGNNVLALDTTTLLLLINNSITNVAKNTSLIPALL